MIYSIITIRPLPNGSAQDVISSVDTYLNNTSSVKAVQWQHNPRMNKLALLVAVDAEQLPFKEQDLWNNTEAALFVCVVSPQSRINGVSINSCSPTGQAF
ncbi:hypothetical protein [Stutzerimonas stutzeri]|uniref:hypothetical protein n=1 Tax=Stutzerimonas stutzeri TaxID=316 RepID=UPI000F7B252D|nr:hypothetical protein [Stutzerimonas stutzeri]